MKNYICINNKKIELTAEQVAQLMGESAKKRLADIEVGDTFMIGEYEFIVLEHDDTLDGDGVTAVILKDLYKDDVRFGENNNNYAESEVRDICEEFAEKIIELVGDENLIEHSVDLTSDDGLDDYGILKNAGASLLTCDMYRRYVRMLDKYKPNKWWWLATPWSTKTHGNESWVKCVSPSGCISSNRYSILNYGVRPFCILKSDIFVSC